MCKPKDIKEMSVHDMRMSVAEDDLRDAGMLLGYAHAARSHGDETAYKHFAEKRRTPHSPRGTCLRRDAQNALMNRRG